MKFKSHFAFQCGYRALDSNSAFMWEPVKDHVIKTHPELFDGEFNCACLQTFSTYPEFVEHVNSALGSQFIMAAAERAKTEADDEN